MRERARTVSSSASRVRTLEFVSADLGSCCAAESPVCTCTIFLFVILQFLTSMSNDSSLSTQYHEFRFDRGSEDDTHLGFTSSPSKLVLFLDHRFDKDGFPIL